MLGFQHLLDEFAKFFHSSCFSGISGTLQPVNEPGEQGAANPHGYEGMQRQGPHQGWGLNSPNLTRS